MVNIYYQDKPYDEETAKSLGRYMHYCLYCKDIKTTMMGMNSEKILTNVNDNHILVFTNLKDNIEKWGIVLGKISNKIKGIKWKLKIIDLSWQEGFPIITEPGEVIISMKNDLNWLTKLRITEESEEIKMRFKTDYTKEYFANIDHRRQGVK